jgi:hypothetical protein
MLGLAGHPGPSIALPVNLTATGQALKLTATNPSNSTSTGGGLNITHAGTGAGLIVYSNSATADGRLVHIRADNAAFAQTVLRVENDGIGHAMQILHNPNEGAGDSTSIALDIVSNNPADTALGVQGQETGRGTIKVTHVGTGTDANASAISIAMEGAGTVAQGIFMDYTDAAPGANVPMLNLRHSGTERLKLLNKAVDTIGAANLLLFGATEPATGQGGITMPNAAVAPAAVANNGTLYVSAGALRYRGPTTDTQIAPA